MSYFLDPSAVRSSKHCAKGLSAWQSLIATIIGVALALFGASGVFGQLQDALNTIWGVKAKPGAGYSGDFCAYRFLSFAMVAGICFLLLVSLTIEALLKGFSHYVQSILPGGIVIAMSVYLIFDFAAIVLLFAHDFQVFAGRENSMARRLDRRRDDCDIFRRRKMGSSVCISAAVPPVRRMERPAHLSHCYFGFIIHRKSCFLALNSPRSMQIEPDRHLSR